MAQDYQRKAVRVQKNAKIKINIYKSSPKWINPDLK